MPLKRPAVGLTFCLLYSTSYFTNKYVLSVLKFTYPTLFQGWQTLIGGLLLHASWKWGWVEMSSSSRTEVISWLPASALFVGIIYSGSRALSRLPIPIFLTLHNAAEVITCGIEKFVQKEQISLLKICRVLILLVAAGCLPFCDPQFDEDGYFWAVIHLLCVGGYKVYHKLRRPSSLSVVVLAFASHPTGDLFSALDFPFLYLYSFHSSCCASGLLGFFLTLHTLKLKSSASSGQYAAWNGLAKLITAGLSPIVFEIAVNVSTVCCVCKSHPAVNAKKRNRLADAVQQGRTKDSHGAEVQKHGAMCGLGTANEVQNTPLLHPLPDSRMRRKINAAFFLVGLPKSCFFTLKGMGYEQGQEEEEEMARTLPVKSE